ncbi:hypothetical protein ACTXQV_73355, partial [Klebsiella pneumoniae]
AARHAPWHTRSISDFSGSLTQDGRVRGRLVGYEKVGDSYLDRYSEEKNGFQGILEADVTDTTNISAAAGAGRSGQRLYP